MRRRDFIVGAGAAVAWPLAARAQQRTMPVVGYLSGRSLESDRLTLAAVRDGLKESGFEEGRNLVVEHRFANGQYDRVPALAAELIGQGVGVIVYVGGTLDDRAHQELLASNTPAVVVVGSDPVNLGLPGSFNRPGGNVTAVSNFVTELSGKILGLLHELVPGAKVVGVIADENVSDATTVADDARNAAAALGVQLVPFKVGSDSEIESSFATMSERRIGAVHVATSPFFVTRAALIAGLAMRYKLPAIYARREFVETGGLMSYSSDVAEGYRIAGNYAGRILKGTKPADLPVARPTKFELVINLKTASAIGLDVPPKLLALADRVIE